MIKIANGIKVAAVYHGSGTKLDSLEPRDWHGDPDVGKAVFGTQHKQMALAYLGGRWGDRDIEQGSTGWGNNWALKEMRPGAFKEIYPKGNVGYLHELPDDTFSRPKRSLGSDFEVVSPTAVTPKRVRAISDVKRALRRAGVKLVKYKENVASGAYDKAVARMADRANRMDQAGFDEYLDWVKETNPTLSDKIKAKSLLMKQAAASTQEFTSIMSPANMDKSYKLTIPDVWKFMDSNPSKPMNVDVEDYAPAVHMNPWQSRGIQEILKDYEAGTDKLTHSKRMRAADDRPIALIPYPKGVKGATKYFVLDGNHRLARAIVEKRKSMKARLYNVDWSERIKDSNDPNVVFKKQSNTQIANGIKVAAITLDIDIGDTLLMGRFKNSPKIVKKIETDDMGQLTINGKKALTFRIEKLMPPKKVKKK